MACPYRSVLCPPLCAAYTTKPNTHIVTHQPKLLTDNPSDLPPSNCFNLHPTSGTDCWPQRGPSRPAMMTSSRGVGGTYLLGRVFLPPHLASEDMQSDSPQQEMVFLAPVSMSDYRIRGHLSSTPTTGMWEGWTTTVVNISREWLRCLWGLRCRRGTNGISTGRDATGRKKEEVFVFPRQATPMLLTFLMSL